MEKHITLTSDTNSVVETLRKHTDLSTEKIKLAMNKGAVWLSRKNSIRRIRRNKTKLLENDEIHFYYNDEVLNQVSEASILINDRQQYSVWYKPYGVYSQGSKWGDHCSIQRLVEQQLQRPVFLVHRLDRATSGLILIAHNKKAAAQLSALFANRQIDKRYQAITEGKFDDIELTVNTPIDGRNAISHIRQINYNESINQSLSEIRIGTGRKHQIRRHLAELGHPIVGDRLYGSGQYSQNLQLCAISLQFICPHTSENQQFVLGQDLQLSFYS